MGNGVWSDVEGSGGLMRIRGIGGGKLDGHDPCVGSLTLSVVLLVHCIRIFRLRATMSTFGTDELYLSISHLEAVYPVSEVIPDIIPYAKRNSIATFIRSPACS